MTNCDNYCDTQFDRCQSDASDRQIGHLVSELCELTDDEIKIVEEGSK